MESIAPGIWKIRLGSPEALTPVHFQSIPPCIEALTKLPAANQPPISESNITMRITPRGFVIEMPLSSEDQLYGLGLQLKSMNQTGLKKTLRVNSDPVADTGDSHAPVPFLVSNQGWGLLIDSARYITVYCGTHRKVPVNDLSSAGTSASQAIATDTESLYAQRDISDRQLVIEIPAARGVDVYVFAGPEMAQAVERYNLFSGGGCLPAMWGLGVWYRGYGKFNQNEAITLAKQFRERHIPCDVFGLEPGWQSQAYSCSFIWSSERFPQPDELIATMTTLGYKINLWEHVFTHPSSPIYSELKPYSGDYEVWGGLVPDLTTQPAFDAFAGYHDAALVSRGIMGFKLDECDHSDFIRSPWSFPEISTFPSGLDGEQMHSLLGIQYQRCINSIFHKHNTRMYSEVRSSHALAAPYPFVLYSDLYDHRDFVRGVVNMGFSGLLWTPEVRDAQTTEELIRRVQAAMMSPQALINAWYISNPPWRQINRDLNNAQQFMDNWEEIESLCRESFELRMQLIPYLYTAFARYHFEGRPPFRALVMDYPHDPATFKIDDQYMMGDDIMVAPVFAGQAERQIYLPAGGWYDFYTHERIAGGQTITVQADLNKIPLYVKAGAMLPLAKPVEHIAPDTVFELTMQVYDNGPRVVTLYEDDGTIYNFESGKFNHVAIAYPSTKVERKGNFRGERYKIVNWQIFE